MTQTDKILDYIKTHGSIDPLRAMTELGVMRLASRIHDIRSLGVPVKDEMQYRYDADGKILKKWKEYRL